LYVLTRRDLSPAQQLVQAAHAVLEHARHIPPTAEHPHLVVAGVDGLPDLCRAADRLRERGVPFVDFREPDINDEPTAIAAGPVRGRDRAYFRRYRLLNPQGA